MTKVSWALISFLAAALLMASVGRAEILEDFDSLGGNKVLLEKARALNPDQEVMVVQDRVVNRKYRFEMAPEFNSVLGGDNFLITRAASANAHFHFNHRWSLGAKYSQMFNRLSQDGENLLTDTAAISKGRALVPDIDYPKSQWLLTLDYYPLYGKLNFFNKSILQFDIYGLVGAGRIELSSGSTSTWTAGAGVGFWISQHLTTRLEMRYQNYKAVRYNGPYNVDLTVAGVQVGYLL